MKMTVRLVDGTERTRVWVAVIVGVVVLVPPGVADAGRKPTYFTAGEVAWYAREYPRRYAIRWCRGTDRTRIGGRVAYRRVVCQEGIRGVLGDQLVLEKAYDGSTVGSRRPRPTSSGGGAAPYVAVGSGHWIREVSASGAIVTLEDGSLWQINSFDRIDTALWLPVTEITVLHDGGARYRLVNTDDGEVAGARFLGQG